MEKNVYRAFNNDDASPINHLLKLKNKHPIFRIFVASKTKGNSRGRGADRSVILGTTDGKEWFQAAKVWGKDNEKRAAEIVKMITTPS